MDLTKFVWTREPKSYVVGQDTVEITTNPYTDLWQRTYYHFRNDNAPVFQMETEETYFSFTVKTEFRESHHRFDQCGIVMYLDSENWLKGSIEYESSLARKDPGAIELGYNGVTEEVFTGFVARPYNYGGGADEITLKDEMLLLEDTQINNTFLDTTPQEVISYVLAQAGVGKKKLNARGFPTRKKLPIRQMSGVQAINAVNAAWSLKERFFFSGGVFYWGEKPEQQKVYTFEYGVNIINLVRLGGVWELETVSAPFVRHSHKINVIHPKISGEQEVTKVVSSTNDDGFIRTRIVDLFAVARR